MGGFALDGVFGRIPCPHCGGTDCAGFDNNNHLMCYETEKSVSEDELNRQAKNHKMSIYNLVRHKGFELKVVTFVSDSDASLLNVGDVEIYHDSSGYRGTAQSLDDAKLFAEENEGNHPTANFKDWVPDRYKNMTNDDFDAILVEILNAAPAANLLTIPGVYEEVKDHFNNEVLSRWESRQE